MLGYPSQFTDYSYAVPQPPELGLNGSFVALRILEQDCAAFDGLMKEAPEKFGISGETLAAKMVGRWRNGVPLHASPDNDSPNPPIPLEEMNSYDYIDDPRGFGCPAGAHMRRNNPRNSPIAGGSGLTHRIARRGLPYGPPFDPAHPDDGIERLAWPVHSRELKGSVRVPDVGVGERQLVRRGIKWNERSAARR